MLKAKVQSAFTTMAELKKDLRELGIKVFKGGKIRKGDVISALTKHAPDMHR